MSYFPPLFYIIIFGPKDVTLSIKLKLPYLANSRTREKSSTKILVLHPPDFLIVLLQYKFGDVPEK